jgi:sugar/nucleoside kinase (ribokinase family)
VEEEVPVRSITVAGHICADIKPKLHGPADIRPGTLVDVGPLEMTLGGCVANTAGTLADLGMSVEVSAAVGDDDLGRFVAHAFRQRVGWTGNLDEIAGATTSYSLVVEAPGADRAFWHHTGANREFTGRELDFGASDILHLGYPPLLPALLVDEGAPLRALLQRARDAGTTTSVDLVVVDPEAPMAPPSWEPILRRMVSATDVMSPSLDDLVSALRIDEPPTVDLAERLAQRLLEWGAAVAAITCGPDGLVVRTAGADRIHQGGRALKDLADQWARVSLRVAPEPVTAPRTTKGAGDAASAGLLFAIAQGASPEVAAGIAVECAATVIRGEKPQVGSHFGR